LYKDGYITGQELGFYLKNKVPQYTEQTPQYGKIKDYELSRGDFIFVVKGYQSDRNQDDIVQAESANQQQAEIIAAQQAELKRLRQEKERAEQQAQADRRARKQAQIAAQQAELKRLRREKERAEQQAQADRRARIEAERRAQEARRKQPRPQTGRYTDNGDGTVTDNRSGLIWLKNANCFGAQKWETAMQSAANLASGQCGLRDGSRRGMWRLPTKKELKAMIDKKYVDEKTWSQPAISNATGTGPWKEGDAFSGVQSNSYWSSSTGADYAISASYVGLSSGDVGYYFKTYSYYVWPLRGGV